MKNGIKVSFRQVICAHLILFRNVFTTAEIATAFTTAHAPATTAEESTSEQSKTEEDPLKRGKL